jgi:single-stranded-DNA-specific exonuclease
MEQVKSPTVQMKLRKQDPSVLEKVRALGEPEIVSIIAANRLTPSDDIPSMLRPSLKDVADKLMHMKDLNKAAERVSQAILNDEVIALCVDFDVDGISSGVVLKSALVEYFGAKEENIRLHVNKRLEFGYGFNPKALDVILQYDVDNPPTLLITADQGSNDNAQTLSYKKYMKSRGVENCDVIITDHHEINTDDAGRDAFAFVNPQQKDCNFYDKTICGCVVALFLCVQTRLYLEKHYQEIGSDKKVPRIEGLIPFACMATIADCVSLRSEINRFIIRYGKSALQKGIIPAFKVIKDNISTPDQIISTKDIAFSLAPRINADSRTGGDGMTAVNFLMAKTEEDAIYYFERLTKRNNRRKDEEKAMLKEALVQASHQYYEEGKRAFTIYLPDGNHGIHGIVASRIKERFNCPVIMFAPVDRESEDNQSRELSASGRSIDGIHINEVLQDMKDDGMPFVFGGHKMALGVKKLLVSGLPEFAEAFDKGVKEQALEKGFDLEEDFKPFVLVDHVLGKDLLPSLRSMNVLEVLNKLDPYGQKFDAPVFALNVKVVRFELKGQNKEHVKIKFKDSTGFTFDSMYFQYASSPIYGTLLNGGEYTLAVELGYDSFYKRLGIQIQAMTEGYNNIAA